ncbi:MAG: hypothetical protein HOO95_00775 [Gallionella sp.]|nr:hypothetical protein [Gallionella sp.]
MKLKRLLKHFWLGSSAVKHCLPKSALDNIEQAIKQGEKNHAGQICFAVEASLDSRDLWANKTARQRAIEVFSQLRIWDTEQNNGVLIYLLLADRDVEIVADRGVDNKIGKQAWEAICHDMETSFRQGDFEQGIVKSIRRVSQHLAEHYPNTGEKVNELPDKPVVM